MRTTGHSETDTMPAIGVFDRSVGQAGRSSSKLSLRSSPFVGRSGLTGACVIGVGLAMVAGCNNEAGQTVIVAPTVVTPDGTQPVSVGSDGVPSSAVANTSPAQPTEPLESIPEVGVPGLGSDDAFCAAWSEWAGSVQVILVTASFSDPAQVPALEVAASPTLVGAYDAMLANWPPAIADARDVAANDYFGPTYRRSTAALSALEGAGADPTMVASIRSAWYQGLEQRDPTTPEFTIDLPDPTWATIDAAAAVFSAQVPQRRDDSSLVITANTDAIDAYIADTCPDRGTLAGLDVTGPDVTGSDVTGSN